MDADQATINQLGELESASEGRMVVRILGYKVGTSEGWFHHDGWAVVCPNYAPDEGIKRFLPDEVPNETGIGLILDLYSGEIVLIRHGDGTTMGGVKILQRAFISREK